MSPFPFRFAPRLFFCLPTHVKIDSAAQDTLAKAEAGMDRAQANHLGLLVCANDLVQRFRGPAFKAFDRTYRFTDMWMDRGGKWKCAARQVSLVSQK